MFWASIHLYLLPLPYQSVVCRRLESIPYELGRKGTLLI